MASQHDEDDYNSSSDEDYDPEKDTEVDPQDEVRIPRYRPFIAYSPEQIDDAEAADEEPEDVEALKKEAKGAKSDDSEEKSKEEDVDALFAELTGLDPTTLAKTEEKKEEVKVYPKSAR